MCKMETAKLMYRISNTSSHTSRSNLGLFIILDEIHSHSTCKKSKTNYFLPRVNAAQTQKLLIYNGTKIWNQISKKIREMKLLQFNKEPSEHGHMGTTWVFGGQMGNWALRRPIYWGPSGLSLGLNELL